jgi:Variant SH3 domain
MELSFHDGDLITDILRISIDWWYGKTVNGNVGLFFSEFVSAKSIDINYSYFTQRSL